MSTTPEDLLPLLHQALGFAELVGFVMPGGGLALAFGAAATDDLLSLFFEGGESDIVRGLASTGKVLVEAVELVGKQLEADIWAGFRDEMLEVVEVAAEDHADLIGRVLDGSFTSEDLDPVMRTNWIRRLSDAHLELGSHSQLAPVQAWILDDANAAYRHQLTPIYLLVSSLRLSYCKLVLLLETVRMTAQREDERAAWSARHPDGQGSDDDPEPPRLVIYPKQLHESPAYAKLFDVLKSVQETSEELVGNIESAFSNRAAQIEQRSADFRLVPWLSLWIVEDQATEYRSDPMDKDAAQLALTIARGKAVTEFSERLTQQLELRAVDERVVAKLKEILGQFDKTKKSFSK